jgi:hypothetical protein
MPRLDERWGLEKSAKGTRFKLNRDFGGYALYRLDSLHVRLALIDHTGLVVQRSK